MNALIRSDAKEPIRTVVLDGLSWRDIALGAVVTLVLVLFFITLAAVHERNRQRELAPEEGGDLPHPVRPHR